MNDRPRDPETDPDWLRLLFELNEVVAACGELLAGNLLYDHHQTDYRHASPHPVLRPKRDRMRRALRGRRRLLEVGTNGGHSALLALTANPGLEFHGVDICEHAYAEPAMRFLERAFPGRTFFHPGNCLTVLPAIHESDPDLRFDAFHIDGAKRTYYQDIRNCVPMAAEDALVIVDDTQQERVTKTWNRCVRKGLIDPLDEFAAMPESIRYRHAIGRLGTPPDPTGLTRLFDSVRALGRILARREGGKRDRSECHELKS